MRPNAANSYDSCMETTGIYTSDELDDPENVRILTQDEWDAENADAQQRQSRALELMAEHRNSHEIQLPKPQPVRDDSPPSVGVSLCGDATYASPMEIMERIGRLDLLNGAEITAPTSPSPLPGPPAPSAPSTSPWDQPVDWSECVATPLTSHAAETSMPAGVQTLADLREHEIDLRGGSILFDPHQRPMAMARAKRRGRALQR